MILEILGDERYCAIARCTASLPVVIPHHQNTSCPPCLSVSRSHLVPVVPAPRTLVHARDIGLEVSSVRKFAVLYRSPRKFPLQSDIHSPASCLSSITRRWRCCYSLFEAAFSSRFPVFFFRFSLSFFPGSRPLLQVYDSHFRRKNRVISENTSEIPPTWFFFLRGDYTESLLCASVRHTLIFVERYPALKEKIKGSKNCLLVLQGNKLFSPVTYTYIRTHV